MAARLQPTGVFLNIPYDEPFKPLYVAYIVGLVHLGLDPAVTLGLPGGATRIDRIFDLVRSCRFSVHDLSRVELDSNDPPTPRFNMPFELGLAVAWSRLRSERHAVTVFESTPRRGQKSLSDLAGSDFYIHQGTPRGVMRELCSAFIGQAERPTVPVMMNHFQKVWSALPKLLRDNGTKNVYEARMFNDILVFSQALYNASTKT